MKNLLLLLFMNVVFMFNLNAQYFGLEGTTVPENWSCSSSSKLSMTTDHYKLGNSSVKWDYTSGSEITVVYKDVLKNVVAKRRGGMMLWIYNEKAVDGKLRFEFSKGKKVSYFFDYIINFTGWRACWISFNGDMSGDKKEKDLDTMRIIAPKGLDANANYVLCFDRMTFPIKNISHKITPDAQLPFINPKMAHNHWGALHHWETDYKHDIKLEKKVSKKEQTSLRYIEKNILHSIRLTKFSAADLKKLERAYKKLNIETGSFGVKGQPLTHKDERLKTDLSMRKAGALLFNLASASISTKDDKYSVMFANLLDHVQDQGLAYQSGFGTNHHYGYEFRQYPPAIFLMRDYLAKHGKLEEISKTICYWSGIQEFRILPESGSLQGLVDTWNTTIMPRLLSVMLLPSDNEKVRELKALQRWMNSSLQIVPGTMGGIKADGCMFHHGGLYPAYGNGGFSGLGKYIAATSNTIFDISDDAKINLGLALNTMKTYTLNRAWGSGICGRHPLIGKMSAAAVEAFASLAKAGNPYNRQPIWKEMAESYLNLKDGESANKTYLLSKGFKASKSTDGHFTFNYGALGIHRKDNWMVVLKGYNKNVWASEIYTRDNRFGRYQSYGTLQILSGDDSDCEYSQDGWDWNRFPGATAIHLPLELLESPKKNTLMEKSKQSFAGSSNLQNKYGVFGMILAENKRKNFTKDFRAYKSVFCFEDVIIALGSNISNTNNNYNTETTIFQLSNEGKPKTTVRVDGKELKYELTKLGPSKTHLLNDSDGNSYFFPKGQNLVIQTGEQISRHNKTKKETKGSFTSAWIDHGAAPEFVGYEYVVLPQFDGNKKVLRDLSHGKLYNVLQKNEKAHILYNRQANIISYVFFDKNESMVGTPVKSIDHSSLLIIKFDSEQEMSLSLCDPDLHLPSNKYTTSNSSQENLVTLKLFGEWKLKDKNPKCKVVAENGVTTFVFSCVDGLPVEINIRKK